MKLEEYTPEYCRNFILKYLIYHNDCMGDCICDIELLPYKLVTARQYIQPIRDEFQKMIDEGYFEPTVFYGPTKKAIDLKEEQQENEISKTL